MRRPRTLAALLAAGLCAQTLAVLVAGVGVAAPGGPPPTPVNGTPSPFPRELHTPAHGSTIPPIEAASVLLADLDSGDVLVAKAAGVRRPIASVTKVMTALVVMEASDLDERVRISGDAVFDRDEYGATSTLGLRAGEPLSVRNLLYGAILGSANDAARALAIHVAGSEAGFVELMNERARALGMRRTRFASATGLDDRGRSTANDLVKLAEAAFGVPRFTEIARTKVREMPGPGRKQRRIQNRNVLLWLYPGATGGKTGSTAAAGYCLMATAQRDGRHLVAIVLRAPDEPFSDAAALLNYGFEGFTERILVASGQALGIVGLRGGSVPVVAGGQLEGLVPSDVRNIRFRFDVDPGATYPPAAGDVVGIYRASSRGVEIGAVPLIVSEVPGPRDPGEEPWWFRAASAIAGAVGSALAALF